MKYHPNIVENVFTCERKGVVSEKIKTKKGKVGWRGLLAASIESSVQHIYTLSSRSQPICCEGGSVCDFKHKYERRACGVSESIKRCNDPDFNSKLPQKNEKENVSRQQ